MKRILWSILVMACTIAPVARAQNSSGPADKIAMRSTCQVAPV